MFGYSVSISGDTAIVGTPGDDAAYVFFRNQNGPGVWGQVVKLTASHGTPGRAFGESVSIAGDTAVIGSSNDDPHGPASGSAYVFARDMGGANAWGEVVKLDASDGQPGDVFGRSVAISVDHFGFPRRGDTIIVGAPFDDDHGDTSGSAYIFARNRGGTNAWGQVAKLTASDGAAQDGFGHSVAISHGTAIVSAPFHAGASGSAYLFDRDDVGVWAEVDKITASDARTAGFFGSAVSISETTAVIGANDTFFSGAAYVFRRGFHVRTWHQADKLIATDGADWSVPNAFGGAVSLGHGGDTFSPPLIIGAIGFVGSDAPPGAAYDCRIYFQPPIGASCNRSRTSDPVVNSQVTLSDIKTSCCTASQFVISATITNIGEPTIRDLFFQVTELTGGNLLMNADRGPGGVGAMLTPDTGDGGFLVRRGGTARVTFVIGLASKRPFRFLVNVRGDTKAWP